MNDQRDLARLQMLFQEFEQSVLHPVGNLPTMNAALDMHFLPLGGGRDRIGHNINRVPGNGLADVDAVFDGVHGCSVPSALWLTQGNTGGDDGKSIPVIPSAARNLPRLP